jgi:hypothetical protein
VERREEGGEERRGEERGGEVKGSKGIELEEAVVDADSAGVLVEESVSMG